jgi:hypothetical protein
MLEQFSYRLLTLLQFTRMALVFTAISDSLCTFLLARRRDTPGEAELLSRLDFRQMLAVAFISMGLYGFGMSLNDIIDRRRDRQIAAHRPLPSGRMALVTAHIVCAALACIAIAAGGVYASLAPAGWRSLAILLLTGLLIAFYDSVGKYLVATGLLCLGLIRFFHAVIPAPHLPVLWHPLLLFTHVAILSTVAYCWEEKRPPLTRMHWIAVLGSVALIDLAAIGVVWWKSVRHPPAADLCITPGLMLPLGVAGAFVLVAWHIRRHSPTMRQAGGTLMLTGLLWLIAYDSAFVAVYVGTAYAAGLLLLLPLSYLLVQIMRWWAKLLLLSQQPTYKRIRGRQRVRR